VQLELILQTYIRSIKTIGAMSNKMSKLNKMFNINNSLSPIANTKPSGIPKEELRLHMGRLSYICNICHEQVKSMTYHIHTIMVQKHTNVKREPYATTR
jgi:hypothetical protein